MFRWLSYFFFFNDTATTEIYTLSLHDALPISIISVAGGEQALGHLPVPRRARELVDDVAVPGEAEPGEPLDDRLDRRSEEHTSELQSRQYLVCRLLLEKKKKLNTTRDNNNETE